MTFFDRTLNAASDAASSYQRAQRRRAVEAQVAQQQEVIRWATARIGRLTLEAARSGRQLAPASQPAAAAIAAWERELAALQQELAALDVGSPAPPQVSYAPQGYPSGA